MSQGSCKLTYTRQLLLTYNKQSEAFVMNWIIQNANLETQPAMLNQNYDHHGEQNQ